MGTEPTFDVMAFGGVCWDFVGGVERYPALDEKAPLKSLVQQGGGQAATASVTVARLGGKSAICGHVGDDEFGQKNVAEFRNEGVDTTYLKVVPGGSTQFAFCVAQEGSGHRSIFWKAPSMGKIDPAELDIQALLNCRCLLVDSHHVVASAAVARAAREAKIPVVMDMERPQPGNDELLLAADWPILPELYARIHSGLEDLGEAGRALQRSLGRPVIVTMGAKGAMAFAEGDTHHQPAFEVSPVVDTTGAGDVYHGAFAYGLSLGYGLEENMRFAAAVAALKCLALGGRTGIPSFAEARRLMEPA